MVDVKHDAPITLALGNSRTTKQWKNVKTKWSKFLNKLANPITTKETAQQYAEMTHDQRAAAKDGPCFVGGELKDGLREAGHVLSRWMVVLDADDAPTNWQTLVPQKLRGISHAIYTTHSSTQKKPKIRIAIPLSKPVDAELYVPLCRKLMDRVGINMFDKTTTDPNRLMYWPSHPKGADYHWQFSDVGILNPDAILAEYKDPLDAAEWPSFQNEDIIPPQFRKGKHLDPVARPGWVGAFNRAYTIAEAIDTFLQGIYVPYRGKPDRYTHVGGKTSGGAHIVPNTDGRLFTSWHGTDPVSRQRCVNAFDLVRISLFDEDDYGQKVERADRAPSFRRMVAEVCQKDERVVYELNRAKQQDAVTDADYDDDLIDEETGADAEAKTKTTEVPQWFSRFQMTKGGARRTTAQNFMLILENDDKLADKIGYDEFEYRTVKLAPLPWDDDDTAGARWSDTDDSCLRNYISQTYDISHRGNLEDAFNEVVKKHHFHPVRDYLDSVKDKWDGTPRVDTLFSDYLGAEDTKYNRMAARLMILALIARVMHPGIKNDAMVVLVGAQGVGKSTLLAKLGKEWFFDGFSTVQGKEAIEQLQGHWLIEVSEMQAQKKADNEAIKAFLSRQKDVARMAYGRNITEFLRQCVFAGSTNDDAFLRDPTGNRRFVPVDVAKSKAVKTAKDVHAMTPEDVDQVWAEGMKIYADEFKGPASLLFPKDLWNEVVTQQELHTESQDLFDLIQAYLNTGLPPKWYGWTKDERVEWMGHHLGQPDCKPGMPYVDDGDEYLQEVAPGKEATLQWRTMVSVNEIYTEASKKQTDYMQVFEKKKIRAIMNRMPGWIWEGKTVVKMREYGPVRYWERVAFPEADDVDGAAEKVKHEDDDMLS